MQGWRSLGIVALLLAGSARADDSARAWVERMAAAASSLQYDGILVYQHGDALDAMQVQRMLGADGPRERLRALTGDGRELLRERGELQCLTPGGKVAIDDRVAWPLRSAEFGPGALEHYRLAIAGRSLIAGREAVVVEARALDSSRYGYQLAIDRASGLLLASILVGPDSRPLERMMFTQIQIAPGAPAAVEAPASPARPAPQLLPGWRVGALPAGFHLVAAREGPGPGAAHWLFSDGIASLSVYVEADAAPGFRGAAQRGAVHAYGRRLAAHNVVVVGDLPREVVERVARAVDLERNP